MISISVFFVLCIVYCKLRKMLSFVLCVSSIVREESALHWQLLEQKGERKQLRGKDQQKFSNTDSVSHTFLTR